MAGRPAKSRLALRSRMFSSTSWCAALPATPMKESRYCSTFCGERSYAGARRVVPKVVSESAAMTAVPPLRTTTMVVMVGRLAGKRGEEVAPLFLRVDVGRERAVELLEVAGLGGRVLDEQLGEGAHVARQALLGGGEHLGREALGCGLRHRLRHGGRGRRGLHALGPGLGRR